MTNPYTTPPAPQPGRPTPRWARKRYVLPALGLALFIGAGIGTGGQDTTTDAKPAAARPGPTVTATVTATETAAETTKPEPAATVTATKTVKVTRAVTRTVTAQPAAGGGSDDGGSGSVYYANCSEARAAGAAPVRVGDPGYGRHLDRDGDGVACE